ncbi:hypothetical protein BJX99DRAFT_254760 [Aspergillus californicus]
MTVPRRGGKLAFAVAKILDEAGVPCLIWGWLALALVASDQGNREAAFVINDHQIDEAKKALSDAKFTQCTEPSCRELCEDRGTKLSATCAKDNLHPVAEVHYHVEEQFSEYRILALYKKGAQLWWLPDLELGSPAENDPYLTMSDSNRLPPHKELWNPEEDREECGHDNMPAFRGCSGPWTGQYAIKVLLPPAFLESIMLLYCRDVGYPDGLPCLWDTMLFFLMPYDEELRYKIHPRFQAAWDSLQERGPPLQNIWVPMRALRDSLSAAGELRDMPSRKPA